ncbi:MAG: parvulin-like peptidyl-prolyl isomerase [Myxococcota bacterium]|jgi:parvulin-like peptidyl-prolyl isomerase
MLHHLLLLLLLSLPAWADAEAPATVNGVAIEPTQVKLRAERIVPANGAALSSAERQEALDQTIDEELLYQAAAQLGFDQDPKVQKTMINLLLREEVYGSVWNADFSEAELRAYFDAHPDDFVVPAKRQLKAILIRNEGRTRGEARALIEQAHERVRDDVALFRDVASDLDESPYARRGGDLGFKTRDDEAIDPVLLELAWTLGVGELSEPTRASGGWAIVYVANERPQIERNYAQMRGSVLRKMKNDAYEALYDAYLVELREGARIEVDREVLDALMLQGHSFRSQRGLED